MFPSETEILQAVRLFQDVPSDLCRNLTSQPGDLEFSACPLQCVALSRQSGFPKNSEQLERVLSLQPREVKAFQLGLSGNWSENPELATEASYLLGQRLSTRLWPYRIRNQPAIL